MIVADKPAASWSQEDVVAFELKAASIARQFLNLESLQKQAVRDGLEGYESRLVTITKPTGEFQQRLFWVDRHERAVIDQNAATLLEYLRTQCADEQCQHAILITLVERMLKPFGQEQADDYTYRSQERRDKRG